MNHSDQTKQITAQTEKMLIDQYERLYRLAYSYVHNEADALDIVQESACKAITQCKNLKDTEKLFPWLCRIVVKEFDLKEALNHLEPKNRTIIILRYFEDMKLEDIALAVAENVNTVKARLYRSLKKLRIHLDGTASF